MGITRTIRTTRIGRSGDRSLPVLLSVVVVMVLVYLWTANRAYTNGYNDAYVRVSDRGRRFAFISMSTRETSYDHISLSNKFCKFFVVVRQLGGLADFSLGTLQITPTNTATTSDSISRVRVGFGTSSRTLRLRSILADMIGSFAWTMIP